MKKPVSALLALVILAAGLALSACSSNDPKPVADKFLTALSALDFEKAKTYTTEEGAATLALIQAFASQIDDAKKAEMKAEKHTFTKVEVNGDKAVVYYTSSSDKAEQKLDMVKEKGDWKVNFKKSM